MVAHFEKRWEAIDGKVVSVCMSRRIAEDLYSAIIALRSDWASARGMTRQPRRAAVPQSGSWPPYIASLTAATQRVAIKKREPK